jgi:hypothetical protein
LCRIVLTLPSPTNFPLACSEDFTHRPTLSLVTYSKENKMLRKISLLGVFVLGFCGMTMQARAQVPRTWHDADLTALGGGPRIKASIASLYDPSSNVLRNYYIAADGHVHDLYLDTSWHDEDVTALGGGHVTGGEIALIYGGFPQVFRSHYIALDKHVHSLYLDASGWHDADLTALWGGPLAGWPFSYGPIANVFDPINNVLRVHYLAADQHVHELYLDATPSWHDADLTALGGGPLAVGSIALIYDPVYQVIRNHYLAVDKHMHELYLDASGWHDADLTALGGGPLILGNSANRSISLIYDPVYQVIRSHYLAADGHVHELYLDATHAWHDADLTALGGGPGTGGGPGPIATVFDPYDNVIRSHYLAADGHVHELYVDAIPAWHDADLTALGGGPLPVGGPIALVYDAVYQVTRSNYVGEDLHVHELYLQK